LTEHSIGNACYDAYQQKSGDSEEYGWAPSILPKLISFPYELSLYILRLNGLLLIEIPFCGIPFCGIFLNRLLLKGVFLTEFIPIVIPYKLG
jgi:hypothetical protein